MQYAIEELLKLGPLPSSANPDILKLERYQNLIASVEQPVSEEDARALITLFGDDDCFGLAWTLLHLIEAAQNWPIKDCLNRSGNEWIDRLKERAVA
jgi:hypothetical protein